MAISNGFGGELFQATKFVKIFENLPIKERRSSVFGESLDSIRGSRKEVSDAIAIDQIVEM